METQEFFSKQHQLDHDLLIRIDQKLEILIVNQEREKQDHELRIRRLEMWGAIAIGLSYALQFFFNYLR